MNQKQPALGETITVQLTGKVICINNRPPYDVLIEWQGGEYFPSRTWVPLESIIQPQAAEIEPKQLADVMTEQLALNPQPKYMVTCPYCGYLNYYNEPRNGWNPKDGQRKFIVCDCLEVVDL